MIDKMPNSTESVEYRPSREVFEHLLGVNEEEFEAFRERLGDVEGHLRVWVHPLYSEQFPYTFVRERKHGSDLEKVQQNLRSAFLRTVESVAKNPQSSPLIVYETHSAIESTKELVAETIGSAPEMLARQGIFFIPTENDGPAVERQHMMQSFQQGNEADTERAALTQEYLHAAEEYTNIQQKILKEQEEKFADIWDPDAPPSSERYQEYLDFRDEKNKKHGDLINRYRTLRKQYEEKVSQVLPSLYKDLGMQSALVSGAYLESMKNRDGSVRLHACAGMVAHELREAGFDIDISKNIWPPKEKLKEMGAEIKQTGVRKESAEE